MSQSPTNDSPNDDLNKILRKLQSADPSVRNRGMATLVQQYGSKMLRHARKLTGSEHDAEELLQNCYAELYGEAHQLEQLTPAYLYRKVLYQVLNHRRSKKRKRIEDVEITTARPEEGSQKRTCDPEDAKAAAPLERLMERESFRKAWDQLSRERQQLLHLRIHEGLTHEELAKQFEVSTKTIQTRLKEVLESMRKRLIDDGWELPSTDEPPDTTHVVTPRSLRERGRG